MSGTGLWIFLGMLAFFQLIGNILLTLEISRHIVFPKERLFLLFILWVLPVAGAFYTFRTIGTYYYDTSEAGNTGVTPDVLGIGTAFNPNAKTEHVIEGKLLSDYDEQMEYKP